MMLVELAYGHDGLQVELPDGTDVLRSRFIPAVADEREAVQQAIRNPIAASPLGERVKPGDKVVVVHSDMTRATPNDRLLPVLLDELEHAGVARTNITLLNALGTHRPQTDTELRIMLGDSVVDNYRCIQHDAFDDDSLVALRRTSFGHPVRVNRIYLEADVKILTGFIEPHFFAGFSGGPKGVLPALAGAESVMTNHGTAMIADKRATWGVTKGNPIWEEMCEVALMTEPTMLLNVALNVDQRITGVFAGDMLQAHEAGCAFVRETAMVPVAEPYDIVITTNSGYPLDQNLYQCVKGMSAAKQIVRRGGSIILAGACQDGVPDHGRYAELLRRGRSPQGILDMVAQKGFSAQDQWQVQIQAMIQLHADVQVYSDGLTDEQIIDGLFKPCRNIEQSVYELKARYGEGTRICVLPEGPQTAAHVEHVHAA